MLNIFAQPNAPKIMKILASFNHGSDKKHTSRPAPKFKKIL